jgi:hypothetical protein
VICLLIEASTPESKGTGLDRDYLVCCTLLSLMSEDRLQEKIGNCSRNCTTEGGLWDCLITRRTS